MNKQYMVVIARPRLNEENVEQALEDLVNKVNMAILDGWQPQGGISIAHHSYSSHQSVFLVQAMVR